MIQVIVENLNFSAQHIFLCQKEHYEKYALKDVLELTSPKCNIITVNEKYFRPAEVERLLGDATKAKKVLGWEPKTSFKELVKEMCENES